MSVLLLLRMQVILVSVGVVITIGAPFLCNRIPGLTATQTEICETYPDALAVIGEGSKLGIQECQFQFRFRRWNCSTSENNFSIRAPTGSRETAFLYAISSAGVTFAITQACARGKISSCGCGPPTTVLRTGVNESALPNRKASVALENIEHSVFNNWRWGGCSTDVYYAMKLARRFLDSQEIENDARNLMNLHNNKAGRKAVQNTLGTDCKCHGVSGSCTLKTCWLKLSPFRRIAEILMNKYRHANPVMAISKYSSVPTQNLLSQTADNETREQDTVTPTPRHKRSLVLVTYVSSGHNERVVGSSPRKQQRSVGSTPRRSDLVFLDSSPNYCDFDATVGSLGTKFRRCLQRNSSTDEQSCDILCCGRGYNTHQVWRQWKCNCKFRWCCEVDCHLCQERVEVYSCK